MIKRSLPRPTSTITDDSGVAIMVYADDASSLTKKARATLDYEQGLCSVDELPGYGCHVARASLDEARKETEGLTREERVAMAKMADADARDARRRERIGF